MFFFTGIPISIDSYFKNDSMKSMFLPGTPISLNFISNQGYLTYMFLSRPEDAVCPSTGTVCKSNTTSGNTHHK
jgi:hypothetical protein